MKLHDKEVLTPLQRFWRLLKPDQKEIRNVYIYSVFNGLIYLSLPLGVQAIVNLIQGGQINTSWVILVSFVVLGVALTGLLQILQMKITEDLQQKIFTRAAFEFTFRIPLIRMETLYRHYAPELMNRFFDVMSVQKGLSKILIDFSTASLHIVFGLLLLSLYHPFFIGFSLILVVLVYAIFRYTGKKGLTASLNESRHKYQLAHWLEEMARVSTSFKMSGKTDLHMQRTDEHATAYLESRNAHFKVLIQQFSLMVVFKVIVALGLLAMGGILVMEQQMNIGQFVAAEIIILLIMNSVEKLILSLETFYDVLTALEKIGQVTDLELENADGQSIEKTPGQGLTVQLENVSFTYPGNQSPTLQDVSLKINPGEKLLIIGESGSGKSTMLPVIAGLYGIQEGSLTFNGMPKGNLEASSLYSMVGDYLHTGQLFRGSVIENITLGRSEVTFEKVKNTIERLGLQNFIRNSPKGYQSPLAPEGKGLPRNIIVKLLLARSIVHEPALLVLENPFSELDQSEKENIIDFLMTPSQPWSMVTISTDPYLAQKCDRILQMQKGRIIRSGTYREMQGLFNQ
ncbi:MAG TPA: ABC transporter ATP-binding protein/permease [Cryomorphaceae bacterium]|nr:ABC transporter ATP-binding protein/permease [Owenweeksia sp.]MBF97487.1 ABC transporter ATP-binding protein/permease [Owenweeksia sp.]HAD95920.1 ABC transporter ATP-binding protein/permease [Cryomorphaceae bacterium]HBF19753.1 ABC transporter ATP-binding protein/permease [Cryomorphaceae bacterium]|tara:strand:+ start:11648 stop:13360 length:1713 start_codon:yes stop_codon:yes gene_type:complete